MRRKLIPVIGLVLLVAVFAFSGCAAGTAAQTQQPSGVQVNLSNQQEGISVSGQGKVTAAPDIAIISLGISAQAATVAEAQAQAATAMDKVITALNANGVASKDIQTQRFSITQVTRWDKTTEQEIVIGYRVNNIVVAKIRSLDKAGAIIDAVAAVGGDLTRINGISFSIDDPKPFQTQAREKAMNDARAKAEQMAQLSGIALGKPTFISESGYYPQPAPMPVYRDAVAEGAPTTPISPGELDITVSVQVIYSIP